MLRRRAANQSWQQTSCRDVVPRRHIQGASGLDHLQAGRGLETMPQKWPPAIGPTEGPGPPDAPHRSGPLRCGSKRLRRGLETASGTQLGLTCVRIVPSQATVSATLIGHFNGRVIRNVSYTHRPLDFPLAATWSRYGSSVTATGETLEPNRSDHRWPTPAFGVAAVAGCWYRERSLAGC